MREEDNVAQTAPVDQCLSRHKPLINPGKSPMVEVLSVRTVINSVVHRSERELTVLSINVQNGL